MFPRKWERGHLAFHTSGGHLAINRGMVKHVAGKRGIHEKKRNIVNAFLAQTATTRGNHLAVGSWYGG